MGVRSSGVPGPLGTNLAGIWYIMTRPFTLATWITDLRKCRFVFWSTTIQISPKRATNNGYACSNTAGNAPHPPIYPGKVRERVYPNAALAAPRARPCSRSTERCIAALAPALHGGVRRTCTSMRVSTCQRRACRLRRGRAVALAIRARPWLPVPCRVLVDLLYAFPLPSAAYM